MFLIRFELFQRKFMIKFLNNFLSQVTPFLFYLVGGYLAIVGRLDIGTLVAVIAAYKDLPSPIKELIDWDQQRMDVQIKYTQVVEQFTTDDLAQPELQQLIESPPLPTSGSVRASNLSLLDESGSKVLDGVSFEYDLTDHVAIVGSTGGGGSELAQVLSRLVPPSSGTIEMGGIDITRAPEAVTGRAIAYVGLCRLPVSRQRARQSALRAQAPPGSRSKLRGRRRRSEARNRAARGGKGGQLDVRYPRRLDRLRSGRRIGRPGDGRPDTRGSQGGRSGGDHFRGRPAQLGQCRAGSRACPRACCERETPCASA